MLVQMPIRPSRQVIQAIVALPQKQRIDLAVITDLPSRIHEQCRFVAERCLTANAQSAEPLGTIGASAIGGGQCDKV